MEIFHLWDERLILSSEEVPASEDVFPSTAKLCCVNFSLFTLLWNDGIPVTFCLSCTFHGATEGSYSQQNAEAEVRTRAVGG